ncbi:MAG: two-component sensor histidine kinase [Frankiales bacterium]|nr:two-component sensor histidine kinase [Frankiales bacterium]
MLPPLADAGSRLARRWRRSLQARVVATTLVVSGVVVLLLATLLLDQVGRGLVEAKQRSALSEARGGALQAQVVLDAATSQDKLVVEALLAQLTETLGERGATGDLYDVVVVGPPGSNLYRYGARGPGDVPAALTARLATASPAYAYAETDGDHGPEQTLVVGTVLSTPLGPHRLLQFFPLADELQTYALVRRTAAAAGLLLVVLLALIALLVTRQVVSPVRLAARTAERLAAGRLEERMEARGEDELAVLAHSFNTMAASLQEQIGRLEQLSLLQRRFVSDVSHELRTPLTTVRMAADVLHEGRGGFPPAVARSAELLQTELDRFEELLVDLLEISRYDAGAASLDAEPTDLVALADRVLSRAEALARAKGSALVLRSDGPVVVEVDQVRLERVLRNLVVNAVEHGEGRPVEVQVQGGPTTAAVVVRDRGVGLRAGHEQLVFTRFWRGDPSRARTTGGTGLGLAIAREDVRLHGGELEAWGAPGVGASFRVTLPARVGGPLGPSPLPLVPVDVLPGADRVATP